MSLFIYSSVVKVVHDWSVTHAAAVLEALIDFGSTVNVSCLVLVFNEVLLWLIGVNK